VSLILLNVIAVVLETEPELGGPQGYIGDQVRLPLSACLVITTTTTTTTIRWDTAMHAFNTWHMVY